jgi:hypothetical protein
MKTYRQSDRVTEKTVELKPPEKKGRLIGQLVAGVALQAATAIGALLVLTVGSPNLIVSASLLLPAAIGALILRNRASVLHTTMFLTRTQETARLDLRRRGKTLETVEAARTTVEVLLRETRFSQEQRRSIVVRLKMNGREIEVGGPYSTFEEAQSWSDSISKFLEVADAKRQIQNP